MRVNKAQLARMREETMGCWWPSRYYPGQIDWGGICGELEGAIEGEEFYFEVRGSNVARLEELRNLYAIAKAQGP